MMARAAQVTLPMHDHRDASPTASTVLAAHWAPVNDGTGIARVSSAPLLVHFDILQAFLLRYLTGAMASSLHEALCFLAPVTLLFCFNPTIHL